MGSRFQLLGITREPEGLTATLYEPSTDRVFVVRSGETLGNDRVAELTETAVTLVNGSGSQRYALHPKSP